MHREQCLKLAAECVLKNRADTYGKPENGFGLIARLWNSYLVAKVNASNGDGIMLSPADVAAMMVMLKISRIAATPSHEDSWVDIAGYAACGVECATAQNDEVR